MRLVVLLALVACGASPMPEPIESRPLGLNDVSILLPLPADPSTPVLVGIGGDGEGSELIAPNLVASLVGANAIGPKNGDVVTYDQFHVVALRVDLCPRDSAGPCAEGLDGRLRVVLQPIFANAQQLVLSHDIALHAFYPIPAGELASVVAELRALAAIQDVPIDTPLGVNTGIASAEYTARLRALVMTYARADQLVKLTVIGQNAESAAFAWIFGGFERRDGVFAPIVIPGLGTKTHQHVLDGGGDTIYQLTPGIDSPPGFAIAINGQRFAAASQDEKVFALDALAAIQNPLRHDANDLQCASCHVATFLTARRSESAAIDPQLLPDRYPSPYNLANDTLASHDSRVVRAFGWGGSAPTISQRVVNDSAQVVTEIEARFAP
ncbi:MAG: hypothetical protein ABI867_32940 [Kofleriaceae bacterium]